MPPIGANRTRTAFFTHATRDDDHAVLTPGRRAASGWGSDHMRGMAVCGALASECERTLGRLGRTDLVPIRWSIDMFRPTRLSPIRVTTRVVRDGRRLCLIDGVVTQDGHETARATASFAAPTAQPRSEVWASPDLEVSPPDSDGDDHPDSVERVYWDVGAGWLPPGTSFYTSNRKAVWHFGIPIVDGEEPSPFVMSATVSDVVNAVANVGPQGLSFINADVVSHFSRPPTGRAIGLILNTRTEHHGISAATAVAFDRDGAFGHVSTSGLANPPIALLGHPLPDRPDE